MSLSNRRVGILASPAVRTTGVYDRALFAYHIETIYPADQDRMLHAIRLIKSNSRDDAAHQTIEEASHELIHNGADILLVACSEFSIITDTIPASFPLIDTIDILAEAIIKFAGAGLHSLITGEGPRRAYI